MLTILKVFIFLAFSAGAYAQFSPYTGVDEYMLSRVMYGRLPSEEYVDQLEEIFEQRTTLRLAHRDRYLRAFEREYLLLVDKIANARGQISIGTEAHSFLGELLNVARSGRESRFRQLQQVDIRPVFYELLKKRIAMAKELPAHAQVPFWKGEESLRNAILDDVRRYQKLYNTIYANNLPESELRPEVGLGNLKIFNDTVTQLPALFETPKLLYSGVGLPLRLVIEKSCKKIETNSAFREAMSIYLARSRVSLGQVDFLEDPLFLAKLLSHSEIKVSCKRMGQRNKVFNAFDDSKGTMEIHYYYVSGSCYDGCTRLVLGSEFRLK
jgi:hypothetical protein